MTKTNSKTVRYLGGDRALWPWLACVLIYQKKRELCPGFLKTEGQKDKIEYVWAQQVERTV